MMQKQFYHSRAWRQLSKAFLQSKNYVCERCGNPAQIAHHKQHITPRNLTDPEITLNPANLEALCLNCHNAEHFRLGEAIAPGLAFSPDGNLMKKE